MNKKLNDLFGRFLLLLLLCSPLLIAGHSAPRYKMLIAEELSHQFIQESYDVGITEDSFLRYAKQMYQLGYTPQMAIEGTSDHLSHNELITLLEKGERVKIDHTVFFSCELQSGKYTFRIGGLQ